ncbi:hypothetical protein V2J09_017591 [Rumex salicifolius]
MSTDARRLNIIGEFKPLGLIAESLEGKPIDDVPHEYHYSLYSPEVAAERVSTAAAAASESLTSSSPGDGCDHEIFFRGNRLIWTTGLRVYKRFTLNSPITKACWCCFSGVSQPLLCALEVDTLTIFNTSGELTSVLLPGLVTSIWPLPFGLLLQQAAGSYSPVNAHVPRTKRELRQSPVSSFSSRFSDSINGNLASSSSHVILNNPLEDPQPTYIKERGTFRVIKDFDEITIWTSDCIPLMASYNKERMQHSLWLVELVSTAHGLDDASAANPADILPRKYSFRPVWQAKLSPLVASKVFLASNKDAAPVVCFLLQEQKSLLCLRLQTVATNEEVLFDVIPDTSWRISAIAAEPVSVTRPRSRFGPLAFKDIVVLDSSYTVLLYSGDQCLCKYLLPSSLGKDLSSGFTMLKGTSYHDLKIVRLADAVGSRVNVCLNNGQILRVALRRRPSCSLVDDCITALAEGLSLSSYKKFLEILWGNSDFAYLSEADSSVDHEWKSFSSVIIEMFRKPVSNCLENSALFPTSAWDYLVHSEFHKNYCSFNFTDVITSDVSVGWTKSNASLMSRETLTQFLMECLNSLHALYENLKLIDLQKRDLMLLVDLLFQVADFLGEHNHVEHYIRDFPFLCKRKRGLQSISAPTSPPSLYRWLENCLLHGYAHAGIDDIPALVQKNRSSVVSWARKIVSFYSLLSGARLMDGKLTSGVHCNIALGSYSTPEEQTILAMVGEDFGLQQIDMLPVCVSLPLRHALDKCRESPPANWPSAAYVLLGREDLALSCITNAKNSEELETQTNLHLISMSTPYMRHLNPVIVPLTSSESNGLDDSKLEDIDSSDGSMEDGMNHIFSSSTQLQYGRDLRLNEVRRLLCSARLVSIQIPACSSASDQDLQQAHLWQLAQRTTALPFGRGAFTLATTCTLLTEAITVPKLVLAGRLPAQQNATINLDTNVRNVQELRSWPEFHNAVAAGLHLAPLQGKISRTWITYNRPEEPNSVHAGLLLALGLHGHLHVLAITDIYQYYLQDHESTTVGLMLGLAASYRGTMAPTIGKSFYLHLPAHHPPSFPELEVPTLLQSAALVSLGLLHEGSTNPQTMQFLLGQIGRRSGGDNVLEREGYALSAGFSLGLVALGRGHEALACVGTLVDRLFHYAGVEVSHKEKMFVMPTTDEHNRVAGQILDGVNVDVTAPGAIMALALMFLKTESEVIASRLSVPSGHFELQYVRPDFIMLRVIARNLIMWKSINPTSTWIESQIPEIVRNGINGLIGDRVDMYEVDEESIVQAYVNIVTGACLSLGLKYAGSRNGNVQEILYGYAIYFLNEIKPISSDNGNSRPKGLSKFVDRGTLEICLHLIVLSLSVVMAGSGNLQTFRLLRFLHGRHAIDSQSNYGIQMAVSLAIGFLFLGGGMRTFSTNNSAIACLLITLYPRFPMGPNDNRCHLQAYRHMYVLATEARWIQTLDVDTGLPVYAPLEITIKETEHHAETTYCQVTPCILPERANLKSVNVCGPRYWPQVIELTPEDKPWWNPGDRDHPFNSGVLYIKRKIGSCSYVDDPTGCQSLLSRAMHKAFSLTSTRTSDFSPNTQGDLGSVKVDQLVRTFSSDPSLIAFAQLCCDPSWNCNSDVNFQEFCLQVLFECISKDRPALFRVYLSLYTMIRLMADQGKSDILMFNDSLSLSSLKLALAYNEAVLQGRLTPSLSGIIQPTFLGSIKKRLDDLLNYSPTLKQDLCKYLKNGEWPVGLHSDKRSLLLSWYLQRFRVPAPFAVQSALAKLKGKALTSARVPLLHLLLPSTHPKAIAVIDEVFDAEHCA